MCKPCTHHGQASLLPTPRVPNQATGHEGSCTPPPPPGGARLRLAFACLLASPRRAGQTLGEVEALRLALRGLGAGTIASRSVPYGKTYEEIERHRGVFGGAYGGSVILSPHPSPSKLERTMRIVGSGVPL